VTGRLDAARDYLRHGWAPIPIPCRAKAPGFEGWATFTADEADLPRRFGGVGNVGVRLGRASGGLVDVDLDCPEAIELADTYLPVTGAEFGRASKLRSHRLYVAPGAVFEKFSDPIGDSACLLELRSDTAAGGAMQTVFPPSTHVSGETIEWSDEAIEPRAIDAALLRRACAWLATGCMVARYVDADWARSPSPALPQRVWSAWPAVALPIYRWLGLYNPDDQALRREVPDDIDLAGLVSMIPNDFDRERWVHVGLAIYAASGGSAEGYRVFLDFSKESPRHNNKKTVEKVWRSFAKSPPREIGVGRLFKLAHGAET